MDPDYPLAFVHTLAAMLIWLAGAKDSSYCFPGKTVQVRVHDVMGLSASLYLCGMPLPWLQGRPPPPRRVLQKQHKVRSNFWERGSKLRFSCKKLRAVLQSAIGLAAGEIPLSVVFRFPFSVSPPFVFEFCR